MKVIIAVGEKRIRNALSGLLLEAHHEVVAVVDAPATLKCVLNLAEPCIVLCDGDRTGLELCHSLRSSELKIRPHLIVMDAKTGEKEIAEALDAGADDYVIDPFRPLELLARIRAAVRTLHHQADLQREVGRRESLAKRYNLLGEIVAHHGQTRAASPVAPEPAAEVTSSEEAGAPVDPKPVAIDLTEKEADAIMQRIIRELHFGKVGALAKVTGSFYGKSELTTWAGFILEREQVWFDLLLEVDAAAMAMIFEQTMGRPPTSEQERKDFLVETQTIVSAGFKAALAGKGAQILSPILSRVLHRKNLRVPVSTKRESYRYALAGGSIGLTVLRHACPLRMKSTGTLQPFDITAEDVRQSEAVEIPWLSKGSVLTDRFIDKLAALDEEERKLKVPVFECSPLVNHFLSAN